MTNCSRIEIPKADIFCAYLWYNVIKAEVQAKVLCSYAAESWYQMNSLLINKAIEYALENDFCNRDNGCRAYFADEEIQALRKAQEQRVAARESLAQVWDWPHVMVDVDDDIEIVNAGQALDIANYMTYDIYGKAKRQHGDDMNPTIYNKAVNEELMYGLQSSLLYEGYDYVADLWRDNEDAGANNPDGTFGR